MASGWLAGRPLGRWIREDAQSGTTLTASKPDYRLSVIPSVNARSGRRGMRETRATARYETGVIGQSSYWIGSSPR